MNPFTQLRRNTTSTYTVATHQNKEIKALDYLGRIYGTLYQTVANMKLQ